MISGEKRIVSAESNFVKKVGIFEAEVVKVNPDAEWFAKNGMELKEGSKATEYLGTSKEGNRTVRVDFWVKEVKTQQLFKIGYYLEDKIAMTAGGDKTWYINAHGNSSCVADKADLKEWFSSIDHREAYSGEKELYNFMRTWLDLDYSKADTVLFMDFKKLINGNMREIESQIGGAYCENVVLAAVINSVDKDGEVKEYQKVFNKAVTHAYNMKHFLNKNYNESYIEKLKEREAKKERFKGAEKFMVELVGAYGTKDFYSLKPLHDYNSAENIVGAPASKEISADGDDY